MPKPGQKSQLFLSKTVCINGPYLIERDSDTCVVGMDIAPEAQLVTETESVTALRAARIDSISQAATTISSLVKDNPFVPEESQQSASSPRASRICVKKGDDTAPGGGGDNNAMNAGAKYDNAMALEFS